MKVKFRDIESSMQKTEFLGGGQEYVDGGMRLAMKELEVTDTAIWEKEPDIGIYTDPVSDRSYVIARDTFGLILGGYVPVKPDSPLFFDNYIWRRSKAKLNVDGRELIGPKAMFDLIPQDKDEYLRVYWTKKYPVVLGFVCDDESRDLFPGSDQLVGTNAIYRNWLYVESVCRQLARQIGELEAELEPQLKCT